MSVEKMQKYKEQKANRKAVLAREKRARTMRKVVTWLCALVVVAGIAAAIGVTVRNQRIAYLESLPDYTTMDTMLVEDLAGIRAAEAE